MIPIVCFVSVYGVLALNVILHTRTLVCVYNGSSNYCSYVDCLFELSLQRLNIFV